MLRMRHTTPRAVVMTSIVAGGLLVWMTGTAAQQSNFVGGNPTQMDAKAVRTLRLKFPAGSRSNWHSHSHGQLLMVEEGRSRTQERGGPLLEMGPGQPWFTKAGVEHWHGAAPNGEFRQVALSRGDEAETVWLEKVSDEQYAGR